VVGSAADVLPLGSLVRASVVLGSSRHSLRIAERLPKGSTDGERGPLHSRGREGKADGVEVRPRDYREAWRPLRPA
jgi:hypothetical protein